MKRIVIAIYMLAVACTPLLHGMENQTPEGTQRPCIVITEGAFYIPGRDLEDMQEKCIEGVSGARYKLPSLQTSRPVHAKPSKTIVLEGVPAQNATGLPEELAVQCMEHIFAQLHKEIGDGFLQPKKICYVSIYADIPDIQRGRKITGKIEAILTDIFPSIQRPCMIFLPTNDVSLVKLQMQFTY